MTEAERQALLEALNAEYGAVYAYGVIAAHASPERTRLIAEHTAAHRARRDTTADALAADGATVPPPGAAYTVPFPVTDPISAARLATTVESDTAIAWRAVVERGASATVRRTGVDALTDAAVRLATWQSILGADPPTVAFPGKA
ncbi:ferritin-like domain-containing protein [Nocardia amamiensis]|uniref:ferritin-like domain-containing protein n=1 Tax=Nocardia TaxID=1817 RepID=UPI0033C2F7F8